MAHTPKLMGGLNWGPGKRVSNPLVSPERTTTSTIKKVGLEGRTATDTSSREIEAA